MRLTIQDAIDAGCCREGVEEFANGSMSATVEECLKKSREFYRRYCLQAIILKLKCSVEFAKDCAMQAKKYATAAYATDTYATDTYATDTYAADAADAADAAADAANAAADAAAYAAYAAAYAANAAADAAAYTAKAAAAELDRQDKWLIDRWNKTFTEEK